MHVRMSAERSASPEPHVRILSGTPQARAAKILGVASPLVLSVGIALLVEMPGLALLGVVTSTLLAWMVAGQRGPPAAVLGLTRGSPRRLIGLSAAATVLLLVVSSIAGALLARGGLTPNLESFAQIRGNIPALAAGLVVVWTTAAFGEEILFRGFLLSGLEDLCRSWGTGPRGALVTGLVVSSAVFGLGHLYQGAAGAMLAGLLGFGYGLLFVGTHRWLWPAVVSHGLYDTVGFVAVFAGLVPT